MPTIRYRERDSSAASTALVAAGALAGLAVGVLLAQRMGGISGVGARVRDRFDSARGRDRGEEPRGPMGHDEPEYGDEPLENSSSMSNANNNSGAGVPTASRTASGTPSGGAAGGVPSTSGSDDDGEALEERVLEAFRNDPVLSERAVDIGAIGRGIIELTGFVQAEDESHNAVVLTRGVPGVVTVVNRLEVREDEQRFDQAAAQYEAGDAPGGAMWEGQQMGIGRPRQGTSQDPNRHADPRGTLENRWLGEQASIRAAADDLSGIAERRRHDPGIQGDETGGAPIAPTGVPKGDHVADPSSAEPFLREQTGRVDPNLRNS